MFVRDQRVVCIDDHGCKRFIKIGQQYVIDRGDFTAPYGGPYVCLVGVATIFKHRGFYASRFRPLVERKTDISIFEKLLNPANHKQLEGV